jgi:hypothetical protein
MLTTRLSIFMATTAVMAIATGVLVAAVGYLIGFSNHVSDPWCGSYIGFALGFSTTIIIGAGVTGGQLVYYWDWMVELLYHADDRDEAKNSTSRFSEL